MSELRRILHDLAKSLNDGRCRNGCAYCAEAK